jgi:hypothetical protein
VLWACRCAAAGWLYDDQLFVYEVVQAKKSLHALLARNALRDAVMCRGG